MHVPLKSRLQYGEVHQPAVLYTAIVTVLSVCFVLGVIAGETEL